MTILGIDEVGRGPLAGPLVIGAVILKDATEDWCNGLTDSKKLTAKKRQNLSREILEKAPATALGWVSSQEIDHYGLAKALRLATRRAVNQILSQHVKFDEIIIDGTINFLDDTPLKDHTTTLKKADLLIKEVSAASIIAKVARDEYMMNIAEKYPEYGFEKHVGYGTATHRTAIEKFGPCPEHRSSFKGVFCDDASEVVLDERARMGVSLSSQGSSPSLSHLSLQVAKSRPSNTTSLGMKAENIVASYLKSQGHHILHRNFKTKFYEIDIISTKDDNIYFTEVKYRKSQSRGTSLEQITDKKQQQMRFAAEAFLKYQPYLKTLNPHLAAASVVGENYQFEDWFTI